VLQPDEPVALAVQSGQRSALDKGLVDAGRIGMAVRRSRAGIISGCTGATQSRTEKWTRCAGPDARKPTQTRCFIRRWAPA